MGIVSSRNKRDTHLGSNGPIARGAASKQMDEDVTLLKRTILNDPNSFILNNLMMCIQFFENYEDDIIQIKETLASSYESELNKRLPSQKHVLLPDVLQKHISCNVEFTSTRQTGVLVNEPLQPIRIYVVHNNIEITEQHYVSEYSSLNNGITYNLMVQASENPGYVLLQRLDEMPYARNFNKEDIDPSSTADDTEVYESDGESDCSRNSNMMLPHQRNRKRGSPQTSLTFNAKSLPNLCDDEVIYEDQISLSCKNMYETRSNHDIKTESDCEHMSSTEDRMSNGRKTWSKNEQEIRKRSYQCYPPRSSTAKSVRHKIRTPESSSSSGYGTTGRSGACDSESEWSYEASSMQAIRNATHDETAAGASTKIYDLNGMIPRQCFKKMRINNNDKIYTVRRKRRPQNSLQFRLMMADRQYDFDVFYTSSRVFMNYFADFFADQLAKPLGFQQVDRNCMEESVIHCDKMIASHTTRRIESYEISPAIRLQWPEYAQEWLDRPRSTWPEYNDINKVKDLGCYVVPENSLPKRLLSNGLSRHRQGVKKNKHQELEWQLIFPAAERYLETCMTHSQVQVYLIALMLYKTFLRSVQETTHGLTISHIRNKLFWLIEEDDGPSKWPDNRTGECLIKLLSSLYRCIRQSEPNLPDYFLRDKNLFDKVPFDYLLHSQKQLKRIIENPIMYVFHAMENIKLSDKFFPQVDFTKLFKLLTVRPLEALMNPALDMHLSSSKIYESHREIYSRSRDWSRKRNTQHCREEIYNKADRPGYWQNNRKKNSQNYSTSTVSRTLIMPRKATDSIVEISERCAELEDIRLGALLGFFITHFVKMAECCHKYRSYQKNVYLDQADRLSIILSEMARYKDDAKAYRKKIYNLRMRPMVNSTRSPNKPPQTPKRNQEPVFSVNMKDRFTRQFSEIMKPKNERPQSSHEEHTNKVTKTAAPVQLTNEGAAQADTASAITTEDEDPYASRKPLSKDQGDPSIEVSTEASGTVQKVVSLADNLNETTYTCV
ncbi:PREDICTED: uncharacterized protein LOC105561044 [Vollenhovia emeryi]|uniref:uncharacterized protein LOC105561044 n=1 Tax=Vollenhovia emeryi TaxID=411798 RepID=UPI0005F39EF7|nr:PREDICTED: uncharacterized protein LOC105561044 [Vollenhovia emeryi]